MKPLPRDEFTVAMAREWFAYDSSAGCVIRIKNPKRGKKTAGERAGCLHKASGFFRVAFQGLNVYEHHLVWALCKGYWSPFPLRHRDDNPTNNRIENLVEDTNAGIGYNELQTPSDSYPESMSGVVAVKSGRFRAQIFREKLRYLGTYDTPAEAHAAYVRAKQVLHSPLNVGKPTEELLSQLLNVS
jgi:hypothetical protein